MANKQETGFRPAWDFSGNRITIFRYPVDSSSGTIMYVGDVVANNAAGSVRPAAADAGVTAAGVCIAVYDSNGVPCGSHESTVATKHLTASTAGYADVALALPGSVFRANFGASYTPTSADIHGSVDHVATAGNATTSRSGHVLGGAGGVNTEGQFRILGLLADGNNAWGDYAEVYVTFLESMWGQSNPTVGV